MTTDQEPLYGHERFAELCALAMSGALSGGELSELDDHVRACPECRDALREYEVLAEEGIPHLAARYGSFEEVDAWDDAETRRKVVARVRSAQESKPLEQRAGFQVLEPRLGTSARVSSHPFLAASLAASLVLSVSLGAFWYGRRIEAAARQAVASATVSAESRIEALASQKRAADRLLNAQDQKLDLLQAESLEKQKEIESLRSNLDAVQRRADALRASNAASDDQVRSVSRQRDALNAQLQDLQHAYTTVEAELAATRADREKVKLQVASLETQVDDLVAMNREQQTKLESAGQFLSSDRDIRELMGARNLYIADVFDVDSTSRTRKPFGRVFYTQGKSLIFYAFDLDRQPGLRNASAFQAWGQKDTPQGETAQPVNLGILYMDNETNRRWALHCDDAQELAQIDAVFVTVEPHGGSEKPTGKPFLYAMLRKEANHP